MTTKVQKKIVSFAFLAVLGIVLVTNAFVTLWVMTAIGFNMVSIVAVTLIDLYL